MRSATTKVLNGCRCRSFSKRMFWARSWRWSNVGAMSRINTYHIDRPENQKPTASEPAWCQQMYRSQVRRWCLRSPGTASGSASGRRYVSRPCRQRRRRSRPGWCWSSDEDLEVYSVRLPIFSEMVDGIRNLFKFLTKNYELFVFNYKFMYDYEQYNLKLYIYIYIYIYIYQILINCHAKL